MFVRFGRTLVCIMNAHSGIQYMWLGNGNRAAAEEADKYPTKSDYMFVDFRQ